jgi:thiamine pyrophosphokinase
MKAVLVASGEPHAEDARWLEAADLVVGVDAGAAWLSRIGVRPDAVVGDMDSVDPALIAELEADGVAVERHPAEKDTSDTELAVRHALEAGADEIVVIGAFGGPRLDHEIANLLLLASADVPHGVALTLVRNGTLVTAMRGPATRQLRAPAGALVSLFPLAGHTSGVTTSGLRYPLAHEVLSMGSSRGLSNVVISVPASVRLEDGTLLIVEQLDEGDDR